MKLWRKPDANMLDRYILQLRFGKYSNRHPTYTLHSIKTIAWLLKTTKGRVNRVCQNLLKDIDQRNENFLDYFSRKSQPIEKQKYYIYDFTQKEKDWLVDRETLTKQVSLSLNERAAEFNNKFKTEKCNNYFIRKIYKQFSVKRKMIRHTKVLQPHQLVKQRNEILQLQGDLNTMQLNGFKIVQIDEMMCTVGTIPKVCWSAKKHAMKIDKKWFNSQSIACIAAISMEKGVELVQYYKRSVDRWDFAKYLKALKDVLGDEKVCLFFDQLSVHKSIHVRETMDELGFKFLLNAAYYPDGNGIEYIFGQVKYSFKKQRLQSILNGKRDRAKVQLTRAFTSISVEDCRKAIQKSLNTIKDFQ